jgi:molybdenum cofactor cytidylyltransferase
LEIAAIILAAGESSRMGRPKPLCPFGGRPALELVLDACGRAGLVRVVVLGHRAADIRAGVAFGGAIVVENPDFSAGQTSSLQAGLRALPPKVEAFALFPADHPLITAEEIKPLVAEYHRRRQERQIFVPSYNLKRGHPVLFDGSMKDELLRLPPDTPARRVVDLHPGRIAYVEIPTAAILMDMDTPEDYARCLEEFERRETTRRRAKEGTA